VSEVNKLLEEARAKAAQFAVAASFPITGISIHNEGFDEPAGPRHLIVSIHLLDGSVVPVIREYFGDGGINHNVTVAGICASVAKARKLPPPATGEVGT
jgi:hypothetical protein